MAARIAAHAADLVKGIPGAKEWDQALSSGAQKSGLEQADRAGNRSETRGRMRASAAPKEEDVCPCAVSIARYGREPDTVSRGRNNEIYLLFIKY